MTYFAEELLEGVTTQDVSVRPEAGLTKHLLKEFGHLEPHMEDLSLEGCQDVDLFGKEYRAMPVLCLMPDFIPYAREHGFH